MDGYEKLGAFYLGRRYDPARKQILDEPLLYDAKDLTTHAVCVGMTGSGKTGLSISLLEEAAIDGVPSLVIDPKGDMGNLLLTFPGLEAADFLPWVDPDQARRAEKTVGEHAAGQAELWRNGLASWGQDGERIRRLRESAEFAIYTPGSESGLPISIVSSFAAPPAEVRSDADLMRDRISGTTSGLLGLLGIDADPLRSREHILISNLLDQLWRAGIDLDLGSLIQAIQSPPLTRIGVVDLESFYPERDRFELSMKLNGFLAAPGFQGWLAGEPLDVQRLLYTAEGKPRVAILSIAHLAENERMFFVSLLLQQLIGWMRGRSGTTSLRALLYMDEIFGYIPPTANPPSKTPFLTLLKQARAYGVGVVLATQNPVDLDYKGLSNAGTWFLGRLQTERDKLRVLDGLEGAGAGAKFDRAGMERTLAGMGKRVFLMHNVHDDGPTIFHTRWAMSYLRGPLTRDQIRRLTPKRPEVGGATSDSARGATSRTTEAGRDSAPPVLPPSVPQVFLPVRAAADFTAVTYEPRLVGVGRVRFFDRKTKKLQHVDEVVALVEADPGSVAIDWASATEPDLCLEDLEQQPLAGAGFRALSKEAGKASSYAKWRRAFSDSLYRDRSFELYKSPALGLASEPGESIADFRIRLSDAARERRDRLADGLRKKYARRASRLEERIRRAEQAVSREAEQAKGQKMQTMISVGSTLLSAFLGRKATSYGTLGRATTAMRGMSRSSKEKQDVERAEADVLALRAQLEELNRELENELDQIEDRLDARTEELDTVSLRPRRSDVDVRLVALAWAPSVPEADGTGRTLW